MAYKIAVCKYRFRFVNTHLLLLELRKQFRPSYILGESIPQYCMLRYNKSFVLSNFFRNLARPQGISLGLGRGEETALGSAGPFLGSYWLHEFINLYKMFANS